MVWALAGLVVAALVTLALAFGGWVFPVLIAPAVLAALVWTVWAGSSERRSAKVARGPEKPGLLGPGGPDDPDRGARR